MYIQEDLSKVAEHRSAWARRMTVINKRYDDAVIGIVESGFEEGSICPVGSARVIAYAIVLNDLRSGEQPPGASGFPGRP